MAARELGVRYHSRRIAGHVVAARGFAVRLRGGEERPRRREASGCQGAHRSPGSGEPDGAAAGAPRPPQRHVALGVHHLGLHPGHEPPAGSAAQVPAHPPVDQRRNPGSQERGVGAAGPPQELGQSFAGPEGRRRANGHGPVQALRSRLAALPRPQVRGGDSGDDVPRRRAARLPGRQGEPVRARQARPAPRVKSIRTGASFVEHARGDGRI
mmetsp:Transcript_36553/g.72409  ORF Transcript_36553/g.72409 Transcript_36553/m.72409 type:complete len:212 (+) Transcript_36553:320-955(+)